MKIKKVLVLSSILCILPLIPGFLLYDELPVQMPIHWNSIVPSSSKGVISMFLSYRATNFSKQYFVFPVPLK